MSSAECCFGAAFKDFVLVAADKSQIFSIIVQKTDEDKVSVIDDDKLLACVGLTGVVRAGLVGSDPRARAPGGGPSRPRRGGSRHFRAVRQTPR